MVANGGHPVDLTIIRNIVNSNGTQVDRNEIKDYVDKRLEKNFENVEDRNISDVTINAVHEGMRSPGVRYLNYTIISSSRRILKRAYSY